ncbi:SWR1 complex subunit 2 isoform X1 [Ziziphus jujuba]|uniref:SWR1 complex subunit 2 isoform X1 n=1 Tax=Ziziphus jujuba TaxID=326968 RepID=A0A6P3ZGI4_ZIZJJ|nr:SWR1 complex subunit 2 isoform X1 [Ziziphus jujuba]
MDASMDDAPVLLDRASRASRGKRMTKLLDDEIEEDELFWNQDALKEEEDDTNYEEEQEVADEFDSDFDEDEPEPEEEAENNEPDDRVRPKKRLIFPGKTLAKRKKKKKVLSDLEGSPKDEDETINEQSTEQQHHHHDAPEEGEGERTVRKSTRTAVIIRQAERDAIRAALQATMRPIKRKKEGEEKRMTQEEMLLEAAQTEIMNLRNLERVLAREEEVKKRAIVHKAIYSGPQVRYFSKDGYSSLEFSKGLSFQSEISTTPIPYPEKAVCAITGLPAKYRDPRTGLPYATKEAFKIIRERVKIVVSRNIWTWEIYLIHFLGKVFQQGIRDQQSQLKMKRHFLGIWHVSAEFQRLKMKIQISCHAEKPFDKDIRIRW